MKSGKKIGKVRTKLRLFSLWKPLVFGSAVIAAVGALLWYALLPDTQYKFRRYLVQRKYPDASRYNRQSFPIIPRDTSSSTSTHRTHYLYRFSLTKGTLTEVYRKENASWRAGAVISAGEVYVADGQSIYKLSDQPGKTEKLYDEGNAKMEVSLINSTDGGVYFVRFNDEYDYRQNMYVTKFNPIQKTIESELIVQPGIYESPGMIISGNNPVLVMGGGDGCGGKNRVLGFDGGNQKLLTEFGAGCVEGPRYIGVMNDTTKLLAAAPLKPTDGENGPVYCSYDVLYFHDLPSGRVLPILDMKTIPGCVRDMTYDRVTNYAVIITDATIYVVDVAKSLIVKTISNPDDHPYNFSQYRNMLASYTSTPNDKHITATDLTTGVSVVAPWDYRNGRFPSFVGRNGDDILISTYESKTD